MSKKIDSSTPIPEEIRTALTQGFNKSNLEKELRKNMMHNIFETVIGLVGTVAIFKHYMFIVVLCGVISLLCSLYEYSKGTLHSMSLELITAVIGAIYANIKFQPLWYGIAAALCIESFILTVISLPLVIAQYREAERLAKLDYVNNYISKLHKPTDSSSKNDTYINIDISDAKATGKNKGMSIAETAQAAINNRQTAMHSNDVITDTISDNQTEKVKVKVKRKNK